MFLLRLLFVCPVFFAFQLSATTIVPYKYLSDLVQASDAVVAVRALAPYETTDPTCTHFDCDFEIVVALKGPLTVDSTLSLRQYSYRDGFGELAIAGDFVPVENKVYLVFLDQEQGVWRPMMLSYYVFEEALFDDEYYWVPVEASLSMSVLPLPDGSQAEPLAVYKRDDLLQLIRQHAEQPNQPWDPAPALASLPAGAGASDRALPAGCDFNMGTIGLSRWQDPNISVYYDVTGAPSDAALRVSSTLTYMMANYTGLTLIPAGPTDFTPDCSDNSVSGSDFINFLNGTLSGQQTILVMFEDPCNQLPDLNGCSGTLGIGGSYSQSTTHVYKGDTWKNAGWGYMVVNNGVRACQTETNFDRFLAHELSHALKMDHLDATLYPGNNMNPTCCNAINDKDRECMNYVYEGVGLPPLPVELVSFSAAARDNTVAVQWSTAQEVNNSHYLVEKSPDGLQFQPLATVAAGAANQPNRYEATDPLPYRGDNYYRLIQVDRDGAVSNLGVVAARFEGAGAGYVLLPNPVRDGQLRLLSRDGRLEYRSIELIDVAGRPTLLQTQSGSPGSDHLDLPLNDLPNGVYWLRINAAAASEALKFVKI
jgi:hypothetical protein